MKKTALLACVLVPVLLFSSCKQNAESSSPEATSATADTSSATADTSSAAADKTAATENTSTAITTAEIISEQATPDTSEAQRTLSEYDISKISYTPFEEVSGMEFLSEEQQKAFWLATFVYTCFSLDASEFWRMGDIQSVEPVEGTYFYHTGFSYDSVISEFKSVLSEDILNQFTESSCANVDGEFVFGEGARGADYSFMNKLEFEQTELTDNTVKFKASALYADPENPDDTRIEDYNFEMSLIDGNWVVTVFEFWK